MKLTVNKQTFVDNFLRPLSVLVNDGMVYFEHDAATKSLICICQHSNQTLACCNRYFYTEFEQPADFALRDLQRLIKAIDFIDKTQKSITIVFEKDIAFYEDPNIRFEMSVMEESLARQFRIGLNPKQFDEFDFQIEFVLTKDVIEQLVKARQFADTADALQISQDSSGQVFCELYKHKAPKCDRIKIKAAAQSNGKFKQAWSVPLDLVSVVGSLRSDMRVISKFDKGHFLLSTQFEDCTVKYGQVPLS